MGRWGNLGGDEGEETVFREYCMNFQLKTCKKRGGVGKMSQWLGSLAEDLGTDPSTNPMAPNHL